MSEEKATKQKGNKTVKDEKGEWINSIIIAVVATLILRIFIFAPTIVKGPSMEPTLHNLDRLIAERVSHFLNIKPNRGDIITFTAPSSQFYQETNLVKKAYYFLIKRDYIKRVIGLEGDNVKVKSDKMILDDLPFFGDYQIKDNKVYINGKILEGNHRIIISNAQVYVNDKLVPETYTNGPWGAIVVIQDGEVLSRGYYDINVDVTVPKDHVFVMGDNRNNSSDSRKFSPDIGDIKADHGCIDLHEISGRVVLRFWPFSKFGKVQ
jgi:signal peptidase I